MGVLVALGYNGNVSSSADENPLELKKKVVEEGMKASGLTFGSLKEDPMKAIACMGDPMMPAVVGLVAGFQGTETSIILAGGTQMAAVYALIKHMGLNTQNCKLYRTYQNLGSACSLRCRSWFWEVLAQRASQI
jgi:NaMN:DMB phosphoribosyltransferase